MFSFNSVLHIFQGTWNYLGALVLFGMTKEVRPLYRKAPETAPSALWTILWGCHGDGAGKK